MKTIRTPLKQHLRRLRYQLLPILVFCACVYTTALLWSTQIMGGTVQGEVTATPHSITAMSEGLLIPLPADRVWKELDRVTKGDLLVRIDPEPTRMALKIAQSELKGLEAELADTEAKLQDERALRVDRREVEARRLIVSVESLNLDVQDRQGALGSDRVQLKHLATRLTTLIQLVKDGVEGQYTLMQAQTEYDTLAEKIKQEGLALKEAVKIRDLAIARMKAYDPNIADLDLLARLAPTRAAIATQTLKVAELTDELTRLDVFSPVDGKIVAIAGRPGQNVAAGQMIMTVEPTVGTHIMSYIPEDRMVAVSEGMAVTITVRGRKPLIAESIVDEVGPAVEAMPRHQLTNAKMREWGLRVRIPIPKALVAELAKLKPTQQLRPGQLVEVHFTPGK